MKFEDILVPIDGSEESGEAFDYALPIAKKFNGVIHILHVMSEDIFYLKDQIDLSSSLREEINKEIEEGMTYSYKKIMKSIKEKAKKENLKIKSDVLKGVPYKKINEYVKREQIDLIVMTNHGKGGLKRMMIGSTTDKVIRTTDIPVMTVKIKEPKSK